MMGQVGVMKYIEETLAAREFRRSLGTGVISIPEPVGYAAMVPPCSPGHQKAPVVEDRQGNDKQPAVVPVPSWIHDK